MAILQDPSTPGNLAKVDSSGNLFTNLPTNPALAGNVRALDGNGDALDVTENNALRVSVSNLTFWDQVDGSAPNTNLWSPIVSNMAIAVVNGFLVLNSAASVTANGYAIYQSNKFLPFYGVLPFRASFNGKVVNLPEANATAELGVGNVGTNAAPTDGAFFRWGPAGQIFCVLNNGGSETASAALSVPPSQSVIHLFEIEVVENLVFFYIDDVLVSSLPVPSGQAYPFNAGRQQIFARVYNGGTAPSVAPQLMIGQVDVVQEDLNQNKPWDSILACLGRGAYQSPVSAFGQTANHANSTSPSSASLSNTAAGYTTLGGRFQFAAVAGAATDYALFGFQVPTGYQLILNSISISTANTGAIGGLTGTLLDWALGVNASAVSLATADGAGTWAPRRIPLGLQSFGISAAIGAMPPDVTRRFDTPIVVDSGRFLHVILQIPAGLATGSQILRGDVFFNGFLE